MKVGGLWFVLLVVSVFFLHQSFVQGAAAQEVAEEDEIFDPIEPVNRGLFDIFMLGYYVVLHPLVGIYNGVVPQVIKDRVDDFAGFTRMPLTLINDTLQGNFDGGLQSTVRRTTKSVATLGLYDFERSQSPRRFEDYGQTVGVYGVPAGPVVFFPLAPNIRDVTMYVVQNLYLDPLSYIVGAPARLALLGVRLTSLFSNIDRFTVGSFRSLDAYAVARNGFIQQRKAAILDRGADKKELERRRTDFDLEIDEELLEDLDNDS